MTDIQAQRKLERIADEHRKTKAMEAAQRAAMTRRAMALEDEWYGTEAEALVERYATR